jgi:hydroxypyruvate isomerase
VITVPAFAANLTFLWTELPFLERFDAAREAGFSRVEYMFPYAYPAVDIRSRLDASGLEQVLFNLPAGDWAAGDRGIAADPSRIDEFRVGVERALAYAAELNVAQLNCLAGLELNGVDRAVQWSTLVENVRHAARRLGAAGLRLLVEPVNTFDVPGFLLPRTDDALRLIDEAGEPNVLLQFDAYHVQRMEDDPRTRLAALVDRVGHVQIADDPGRHQPGTGQIDFRALFELLDQAGYSGAVGLEYIPSPDTAESLNWLEHYGFVLSERS